VLKDHAYGRAHFRSVVLKSPEATSETETLDQELTVDTMVRNQDGPDPHRRSADPSGPSTQDEMDRWGAAGPQPGGG
jgi:hypothetical protein